MLAARRDLTIEKKARFVKEFQIMLEDGITPKTLVGYLVKCVIKESTATETALHTLTEANGGVEIIDDALGKFKLYIPADETDVSADFARYDIVRIDEAFPDEETDRVIWGHIIYTKGIS